MTFVTVLHSYNQNARDSKYSFHHGGTESTEKKKTPRSPCSLW